MNIFINICCFFIFFNVSNCFFSIDENYDNILNESFDATRPPTPIEASCLSYYSYLAKLGSLFTQCVVNYSRPFRVCENCLKYYMQITEAKRLIKNVNNTYLQNVLI